MKWRIPAKTFLLGEYAALQQAGAIILTTSPCFEVALVEGKHSSTIHPQSPAGQWWATHTIPNYSLEWTDPYHGCGGLGASSAQFIGAYLASCHLLHIKPEKEVLLEAYFQCAWNGEGLKPSGYDVIAQSQSRCVYINREQQITQSFDWVFNDIGFLLLHSNQKLATHYHLRSTQLPTGLDRLATIVEQGKQAFEQSNSALLIESVNAYQQTLSNLKLTAKHSLEQIEELKKQGSILAIKGCGALGADVLLLLIPQEYMEQQTHYFRLQGWTVLGSSQSLYAKKALIKNNPRKTLEILP